MFKKISERRQFLPLFDNNEIRRKQVYSNLPPRRGLKHCLKPQMQNFTLSSMYVINMLLELSFHNEINIKVMNKFLLTLQYVVSFEMWTIF